MVGDGRVRGVSEVDNHSAKRGVTSWDLLYIFQERLDGNGKSKAGHIYIPEAKGMK
jgi:hypothetical protein